MKSFALILAFVVAGALADGLHGHGRQGRARSSGRRPQQQFRRGREEELATYADDGQGGDAPISNYGATGGLNDPAGGVGGSGGFGGDDNLAMLEKSIPGVPGQDYPILAEVPESAFSCDGQVDGGYYADPEAQCQVFHICTANGQGGLAKYSFLCPNGTIFNQNYFICDWWFNFDCSEAEGLYSLNEKIAAEREAATAAGSNDAPLNSYGAAPAGNGNGHKNGNGKQGAAAPLSPPPPPAPAADEDYEEEAPAAPAPPAATYGSPAADAGAAGGDLETYEADRQSRAFRGGRQGRRQQPVAGRRQQGRRGRQFQG